MFPLFRTRPPSVVVSSATDPSCLLLPRLSPTIGALDEPSDEDDNDDPAGEPRLLAGIASQTSTAP